MKLTIIILLLVVIVAVTVDGSCKTGKCGDNKKPSCGNKGGCGGNPSGEQNDDQDNSGPVKPTKPPCGKKGECGEGSDEPGGGPMKPTKPPTSPTKTKKTKKPPCGGSTDGCGKSSEEGDSNPTKPTKPPTSPTKTKKTKKPPCGGSTGGCGKSSEEDDSNPTKPTKPPTSPTKTKKTKKPPCGGSTGGCGKSSEEDDNDYTKPTKSTKPTKQTKPPTSPTKTKPTKSTNSGEPGSNESSSENQSHSSACRQSSEELAPPLDDQKKYDTTKIVKSFGYPSENYDIITKHGFKIRIQRIPANSKVKNRGHVLLMGGFWTSSLFWVISGPDYSLAIYLSNIGYDVWLGNDRGNRYGQKHVYFDISHPAYWDYSFSKIGRYDIPAIIDFITNFHNCDKIHVIALGYGATSVFVMVSDRPEYAKKISSFHALAPAVFMQHTQSQVLIGFYKQDQESIFNKIGRYQIIRNKNLLEKAGRLICRKISPNKKYCDYIQPLFSSLSITGIDNPYYPAILDSPTSQASVKYFLHMLQQVDSGCFRKFDYGLASNQLHYGSDTPPEYNLSAATMPVAVYYSNDDTLVVPEDISILWDKLPNKINKYCISEPNFSHVHFAISEKAKDAYYQSIADNLKIYK